MSDPVKEKKYVVPERMVENVWDSPEHAKYPNLGGLAELKALLEAAIRWLAENPIVPTAEQLRAMRKDLCPVTGGEDGWMSSSDLKDGAVEWQRRMFLAPEPEVPSEIQHLLLSGSHRLAEPFLNKQWVKEALLEAYRLGRESR